MKLLDIHALSWTNSFPSYTAGTPPSPAILALILLTELRYESFTPNPIRLPFLPRYPFPTSLEKRQFFYLEFNQYLIHLALFILLQSLPQILPVKALGVLFTIWLIWTTIQLLVRYPTSPPLFGPLYLIESLATFWTGTWHNVFASPCYSLAYTPTFFVLTKLRAPPWISRPAAVVAAFAFMAAFHMYALEPLLTREGIRRIGWFFVGNGILTVAETGVWGRKRHWVRALMAWIAELSLASWTVAAADLPDGALKANWRGLCEWKRD
ncbi:hypothetical protein BU24DRAFT_493722 [Aaosphaeria arxii CBS 175.79]|uniref:Wax synthase domain-containing protein n=1 Tax=Aaosphaeria arxii CBS 175.79 TaxID=1450172 RepID=A0A6A5XJQ6_9PLEO|nr:uncharacterized protein BU24DRAFT_493722 [Aaosphaeria arxii CBS 175.79]KAF2013183.1 hypothetical protein BU24DRAFT_493722 [Aaosphaeria arxii CBS 175.79]